MLRCSDFLEETPLIWKSDGMGAEVAVSTQMMLLQECRYSLLLLLALKSQDWMGETF